MTGAQTSDQQPAPANIHPLGRGQQAENGSDAALEPAETRPASGTLSMVVRILLKMIVPLVIVAGGYMAYKHLVATKPEPPTRPKAERSFNVQTVPIRLTAHQPELTLFGNTVAGRQVDIRALVSGQIIETGPSLREGGVIENGAPILKIDPIDYRTALVELEAQLAEARARVAEFESSLSSGKQSFEHAKDQVELAKADLERAEPLASRGTVSERTVDERRQALLQRQQTADELASNIKVWEARIAQQKAQATRLVTAIERANRRLVETELVAPFSAYVTEVGAQVGRMVGSNDKVATLIDRNWIEARFNLTDDQFGRIVAKEGSLEGRPVNVRWVLGSNTFEYPAVVERIGARISSQTGGVEVYARITDPNKPVPLRPGAFVEIRVPDRSYDAVARVPATALYNGDTVFAVVDGRLEARAVTVEAGMDGDLLIAGDLKDADRILTTRISTPGTGVKVDDVTAAPQSAANRGSSDNPGAATP